MVVSGCLTKSKVVLQFLILFSHLKTVLCQRILELFSRATKNAPDQQISIFSLFDGKLLVASKTKTPNFRYRLLAMAGAGAGRHLGDTGQCRADCGHGGSRSSSRSTSVSTSV